MSVLIDETHQTSQTPTSSKLLDPKNPKSITAKAKTLRPDSPTTIQACQELGILIEDIIQK